jgi:hypothetical protein
METLYLQFSKPMNLPDVLGLSNQEAGLDCRTALGFKTQGPSAYSHGPVLWEEQALAHPHGFFQCLSGDDRK